MRSVTVFATWCSCLARALAANTGTVTPFIPPAVPLAVRSPYLSVWLNQGGTGAALNDAWPSFWSGSVLEWAGFAKVDGVAYSWMGTPGGLPAGVNFTKATQKSLEITSTQSIFVMTAGPIDLTVTFLSPVEPADFVNQSIPFSYLAVSAASNDDKGHDVQIYSDISAEWITGDNNLEARWSTTTGNVTTHSVSLAVPHSYTEINDHMQDGFAYYSTLAIDSTTYRSGQDTVVRSQFINSGVLANVQDSNFRAVSDNLPVFALSHDLGNVNALASAPVVFSVGHYRDPAVQYITANGTLQPRSLAFLSRFPQPNTLISTFLNDYSDALVRANAFDAKVAQDASKVSSDYASIVALSIRQTFGATEITLPGTGSDNYNTSDVLMFMKEISSDGNINTVDVIFPAWPLFLYTTPTLGKQLLLPLLEYQASRQYPNAWAVHDVGNQYPNATGHNDGNDRAMPLEETGNMLIMALSYTQRTNDTSLVETYYDVLDNWAQYLVQNALMPMNQFSTDNFAGELANQTNLAIKGIIGIKAMSEIATIMGNTDSSYGTVASQYVQQWEKLAMAADGTHLSLTYGNNTSWGLAYNMYADKLLGTNIFPQSVYDLQSKWYSSHTNAYGVPLDSRHTYTSTSWQMFTAATVSDNVVRDLLISAVRKYAASGNTSQPFGDWYDTIEASSLGPRAQGTVGSHLALLALQSNTSIAPSIPPNGNGAPPAPGPSTTSTASASLPTEGRTNSAVPQSRHRLCLSVLLLLISSALSTAT